MDLKIHEHRKVTREMKMLGELQSFDETFGFLPNCPLVKISDEMYEPWEEIVSNLNGLILSSTLRSKVQVVIIIF